MTGPAIGQTFSREDWQAADAAWAAGDFHPDWEPWRHMAAEVAGIIYPPTGTGWDSWEDDALSQRAILIRAIRETPPLLEAAIRAPGVHGWADVVGHLIGRLNEIRRELEEKAQGEEDAWAAAKDAERQEAPGTLTRLGWPHATGAASPPSTTRERAQTGAKP